MYPFTGTNSFVRNSWYVAAISTEINDGPIQRVVLNSPVALFRMANGDPAAIWGACPHRYYPLAWGKVIGDSIQCNYHGFRFDGRTGACTKIPSQAVSGTFVQRTFPCVEHGPWIWIWPGDPERADRALLPSLDQIGATKDWRVDVIGLNSTPSRAQILVENLMDLTHVAFLHGTDLDGHALLGPELQVFEEEGVFRAKRTSPTPWLGAYYDLLFGADNKYEGVRDVLSGTYFFSPGYMITLASTVQGEDIDPNVFGRMYFHHAITPETETSCHYFVAASRDYRREDESIGNGLRQLNTTVGYQDVSAASEVEQMLQRFPPAQPELLCRADSAAIQVRRRIQAMLDDEARLVKPGD